MLRYGREIKKIETLDKPYLLPPGDYNYLLKSTLFVATRTVTICFRNGKAQIPDCSSIVT